MSWHGRLNVPPGAPRQARVLVAALGPAMLFAVLTWRICHGRKSSRWKLRR